MKDAEPIGVVYKEAVDSKMTLTESNERPVQRSGCLYYDGFICRCPGPPVVSFLTVEKNIKAEQELIANRKGKSFS